MENRLNEQDGSWLTALKKRMLPVPEPKTPQEPIIGSLISNDAQNISCSKDRFPIRTE